MSYLPIARASSPGAEVNVLVNFVDSAMTFFFLAELMLRVLCFGFTIFDTSRLHKCSRRAFR